MRPMEDQRRVAIERRLVDRMNRLLGQYRQQELEWEALHVPVRELEETAQRLRSSEVASQLSGRAKQELEDIEATLERFRDDAFGVCEFCGEPIDIRRLEALPTTTACISCAASRERIAETAASPLPGSPLPDGAVPGNRSDRFDSEERAEAIRQHLISDERLDGEELTAEVTEDRVVLGGAMASADQKEILIKWLTDVLGVEEVVDRVTLDPQLFDRVDPGGEAATSTASAKEGYFRSTEPVTEDIQEAEQKEIPFVPSDKPLPEPR